MNRFLAPVACLTLAWMHLSPARSDDSLPPTLIRQIKSATVLVMTPHGNNSVALGTAWVMLVDGQNAYLVTNHHVVADAPTPADSPYPMVAVIFDSGRKNQRLVPAQVTGTSPERDLAVLKVTGVADLPKPIDIDFDAELVETQSVTVFGFPYTGLDGEKSPPITVTRGSVSSIRDDGIVQLDTNLNPGNSGGPIVDSQGHVVGIAFAKPMGTGDATITGIGLAIAPAKLAEVLDGSIANACVVSKTTADGKAKIEVEVELLDPLEKIESVCVHYLRADKLPSDRPLCGMKKAEKIDVPVQHHKGTGTILVKAPAPGMVSYFCQASCKTSSGKQVTSAAVPFHVNFATELPDGDGKLVVFDKEVRGGNDYLRDGDVLSLVFSPDGQRLATSQEYSISIDSVEWKRFRGVVLYDLNTGWASQSYEEHDHNWVFRVGISPDGKWLASVGEGGDPNRISLVLQELATGKVIYRPESRSEYGWYGNIAFSHDSRRLAVAGTDNCVEFVDLETGVVAPGVAVPRNNSNYLYPIHRLAFSPNGKMLATGGRDGQVRIWDVATRSQLASFELTKEDVSGLAWRPDGKALVAGGFGGVLKMWNVETNELLGDFTGHQGRVLTPAFTSDGSILATCSYEDLSVRLWHVDSAREIIAIQRDDDCGIKGTPRCLAISPDDKLLAVGTQALPGHLYSLSMHELLKHAK